ncbi:MAG TPA: hypothetical protein VMZ53_02625 [Kofleriaceae bacterium]|nr:hypothetical protein [Kofleriaceae bacterium]
MTAYNSGVAGFFDFDWRRLFRWCCLLSIVMAIWLLTPTVKCSYKAFRDTPIGDVESNDVADADKDRVKQGTGFWSQWGTAIKGCYREKPLLTQEPWKRNLLFVFLAVGALAWSLDRIEKRRKRTFDR